MIYMNYAIGLPKTIIQADGSTAAAHQFLPILMFFVFLMGLSSVVPLQKLGLVRTALAESIQESKRIEEQQLSSLSDFEMISIESDSITETFVLNYSQPQQMSNSANRLFQLISMLQLLFNETRKRKQGFEYQSTIFKHRTADTIHTKVV